MRDNDKHLLRISERKVLRKIYGLLRNVGGAWSILMNHELIQTIGGAGRSENILNHFASHGLDML